MTPEETEAFVNKGRDGITALAFAARLLAEWSASFEARGGQPVYGDDALLMVYLNNDLQVFLNADRKTTIARLRADF